MSLTGACFLSAVVWEKTSVTRYSARDKIMQTQVSDFGLRRRISQQVQAAYCLFLVKIARDAYIYNSPKLKAERHTVWDAGGYRIKYKKAA